MENRIESSTREQQNLSEINGETRKPYRKPQLVELGDLRTLTLGLSPTGYFDSGGGSLYENYP